VRNLFVTITEHFKKSSSVTEVSPVKCWRSAKRRFPSTFLLLLQATREPLFFLHPPETAHFQVIAFVHRGDTVRVIYPEAGLLVDRHLVGRQGLQRRVDLGCLVHYFRIVLEKEAWRSMKGRRSMKG